MALSTNYYLHRLLSLCSLCAASDETSRELGCGSLELESVPRTLELNALPLEPLQGDQPMVAHATTLASK